jgi:predicted Ser/Thr protein kinase
MSPSRHQQVKDLFLAACDLPPGERAAYLDQACPNDPDLRADVDSLLAHHTSATILEPLADALATADLTESPPTADLSADSAERPARFLPGTVINDRYRIVTLLGRGAMGEVYRADDLELQRTVALKFMIGGRADDGAWLARFHQEARLALTVTHPNICRVYDIGEAAGEAFISMEFVDGENLASLLRRIGRLPREKMLEITRQLCAGLASAHAQGVLHRDLKPANVMIDGRGRVRLTDFGIAIPAAGSGGHAIAGTPAYMAPELPAGRPASVRSDLYALGLIMYEMITGAHPFAGQPPDRTLPPPPSSVNPDVDPAIDRIILRCIQTDPRERPRSAQEVAAALPGGDRLTAAIEAGETPSPEMVAAAGGQGRMRTRVAIAVSALAAAGLLAIVLLADRTLLLSAALLPRSPHVLEEKARGVIRELGGSPPAGRGRSGFAIVFPGSQRGNASSDRHNASTETRPTPEAPGRLPPPGLVYEFFGARPNARSLWTEPGPLPNPAPSTATLVRLDSAGRLLRYLDVPQSLPPGPPDAGGRASRPPSSQPQGGQDTHPPDWSAPARLAGIPFDRLRPTAAFATPPTFADTVRAWDGPSGFDDNLSVYVEAAALEDRIVYYDVERIPAARPGAGQSQPLAWQRPSLAYEAALALFLVTLAGGLVLARRNLRLGHGDWRGARRIAVFMFALEIVIWAVGLHPSRDFLSEARQMVMAIQSALFTGAVTWLFYVGLEPYVRRLWPRSIVSWSRLLAGRLDDPLIGRDVMVGIALGAGIILLQQLDVLILPERRLLPQLLMPNNYWALGDLLGFEHRLEILTKGLRAAIALAMVLLMLMLLLRLILKSPALAGTVFLLAVTAIYALATPLFTLSTWVTCGLMAGGTTLLLLRFGFLATAAGLLSIRLLLGDPLTADTHAWCAGSTAFALLALLALLGFSLYANRKRALR